MGKFVFEQAPSVLRKIASYSYDIAHALHYYKLAFEMNQERKLELVVEPIAKDVKATKSSRGFYTGSRDLKASSVSIPVNPTVHICTKGHYVLKTGKDSIHFRNANALLRFINKHFAICKAILYICGISFNFDVTKESPFTSKLKSSSNFGPSLSSVVNFLVQVQPPEILKETDLIAHGDEYLFNCKTAQIERHVFESWIHLTKYGKFAYFYKESRDCKKYALFYSSTSKTVVGRYTLERYTEVEYSYQELIEFMDAIEVDVYPSA